MFSQVVRRGEQAREGVREVYKTLDRAQTFGKMEDMEIFHKRFGLRQISFDVESDHAPKATHLLLRQLMLWVRGQAGIDYFFYL